MFSVLVCRSCCCGRPSKHPGIDHDAQVEAIRRAVMATSNARCRTVDCLDVCSRSNVVVVRDRRPEASELSALWLGDITTDELTASLCTWLGEGAHRSSVPELLRARIFDGPMTRLAELDTDDDCPNSPTDARAGGTISNPVAVTLLSSVSPRAVSGRAG